MSNKKKNILQFQFHKIIEILLENLKKGTFTNETPSLTTQEIASIFWFNTVI